MSLCSFTMRAQEAYGCSRAALLYGIPRSVRVSDGDHRGSCKCVPDNRLYRTDPVSVAAGLLRVMRPLPRRSDSWANTNARSPHRRPGLRLPHRPPPPPPGSPCWISYALAIGFKLYHFTVQRHGTWQPINSFRGPRPAWVSRDEQGLPSPARAAIGRPPGRPSESGRRRTCDAGRQAG